MYIQYENNVYTGQCGRVVGHSEARGRAVPGTTVWQAAEGEVLLASCHTVTKRGDSLR